MTLSHNTLSPLSTDERNAATSRDQVQAFVSDPLPYGKSYTAYLSENAADPRIVTWVGDTLAVVTKITRRRGTGSWVTNERGSFWARGIDGRIYYGRHNGSGLWVRMRLAKVQP
jgi:hypothetical protein